MAQFNKIVSWNIFCEKHGKSGRDQHFSAISSFLESESLVKRLESTSDIVDALIKRQKIVNKVRISSKKEPVEFWVGAVDTDLRLVTVARPQRVIVDLQSYYNFHNNDNFVLQTSIYSDETDIHMEVLTDINNLQSEKYGGPVTIVPARELDLTRMRTKKENIHRLFNRWNSLKNISSASSQQIRPQENQTLVRRESNLIKPTYCEECEMLNNNLNSCFSS